MNRRKADRKQARNAKLETRRMDAWLTKRKPLSAATGKGLEQSNAVFYRREKVVATLSRQASTVCPLTQIR
jgi:hypothetical protein